MHGNHADYKRDNGAQKPHLERNRNVKNVERLDQAEESEADRRDAQCEQGDSERLKPRPAGNVRRCRRQFLARLTNRLLTCSASAFADQGRSASAATSSDGSPTVTNCTMKYSTKQRIMKQRPVEKKALSFRGR